MGTDYLRNDLGLTGQGVKIGVISDGVDHLVPAQTGPYPEITPGKVTVHLGINEGGRGDEGTAMIEILHDIAPMAEIYFVGPGGRSRFCRRIGLVCRAEGSNRRGRSRNIRARPWFDFESEHSVIEDKIRDILRPDPGNPEKHTDILFVSRGGKQFSKIFPIRICRG